MKKVVTVSLASLAVALAIPATASAWTYGLSGAGQCQKDGSYKITWKVDNSSEKQALHITDSSNTSVVAVGSSVSAYSKQSYYQVVDGSKTGEFTLTLKGNWPSDQNVRTRSATVRLEKACDQPAQVTPAPEQGHVEGVQVETKPVGAVSAGEGSQRFSAVALMGLIGSIIVLGYGLFRYRQTR